MAAVYETMSFLITAEWLLQESRSEGINESVLTRLVVERTAREKLPADMSSTDLAYQARLAVVTQALRTRHSDTSISVTAAQVASYYKAHRAQYTEPAVRNTLMVVTHGLSAALAARAALFHGEPWRTVAKRWSIDSSAQIGGAFAIVQGEQSPVLERAAFAAARGQMVGPVDAPPESAEPAAAYYLFKVTGGRPASPQPLAAVASQIKQTLSEEAERRSWSAFHAAYQKRWIERTLCAPRYVVAECRNYPAH
jgi:hypothetical protein